MDLQALSAEFDRASVHWRAQTVTKAGDKALALAYLDARDVMDRLDDVCGPENWQTEFSETAKGRVLCRLGIRVDGEWIWKSDGAGNTDVEGEKGGISDALKRAAVSWGIGRYLYRLPNVWCPCETYNGKWSKWTDDPWNHVRGQQKAPPRKPADKAKRPMSDAEKRDWIKDKIAEASTLDDFVALWESEKIQAAVDRLPMPMQNELRHAATIRAGNLGQAPAEAAE